VRCGVHALTMHTLATSCSLSASERVSPPQGRIRLRFQGYAGPADRDTQHSLSQPRHFMTAPQTTGKLFRPAGPVVRWVRAWLSPGGRRIPWLWRLVRVRREQVVRRRGSHQRLAGQGEHQRSRPATPARSGRSPAGSGSARPCGGRRLCRPVERAARMRSSARAR
jgi:hypothetical protein